jgi:hypothetical protein
VLKSNFLEKQTLIEELMAKCKVRPAPSLSYDIPIGRPITTDGGSRR